MNALLLKFDSKQLRVLPYLLYITNAGGKFERLVVRADDDLLGYGRYPVHFGFADTDHSFDEQAISFQKRK
jgi:hypothetical protein